MTPNHKYLKINEIKLGDVIMQEELWTYTFCGVENSACMCNHCFKSGVPLRRCSKCRAAYYCSQACQTADWSPRHKHECRLRSAVRNNSYAGEYALDNEATTMLCAMLSSQSLEDAETLRTTMALPRRSRLRVQGVKQTHQRILPAILSINAVGVGSLWNCQIEPVAMGICIEMARFQHCCRPNAIAVNEGRLVRLIALEDIDSLAHVRLTRQLGLHHVVMPYFERQLEIESTLNFTCKCSLCLQGNSADVKMYGLKCSDPTCRGTVYGLIYVNVMLPELTFGEAADECACNTCRKKYTPETMLDILKTLQAMKTLVKQQYYSLKHDHWQEVFVNNSAEIEVLFRKGDKWLALDNQCYFLFLYASINTALFNFGFPPFVKPVGASYEKRICQFYQHVVLMLSTENKFGFGLTIFAARFRSKILPIMFDSLPIVLQELIDRTHTLALTRIQQVLPEHLFELFKQTVNDPHLHQ